MKGESSSAQLPPNLLGGDVIAKLIAHAVKHHEAAYTWGRQRSTLYISTAADLQQQQREEETAVAEPDHDEETRIHGQDGFGPIEAAPASDLQQQWEEEATAATEADHDRQTQIHGQCGSGPIEAPGVEMVAELNRYGPFDLWRIDAPIRPI